MWTAIPSLGWQGDRRPSSTPDGARSLVGARSAADWQTMDNSGQKRHQTFTETAGRSAYSPLTLDEGEGGAVEFESPRPAAASPAGFAHEPAVTEEALLEAFSCCRAQSSLVVSVVSYKVRQLHAEPTRWVERRCCLA